jgi:hypothetical protein
VPGGAALVLVVVAASAGCSAMQRGPERFAGTYALLVGEAANHYCTFGSWPDSIADLPSGLKPSSTPAAQLELLSATLVPLSNGQLLVCPSAEGEERREPQLLDRPSCETAGGTVASIAAPWLLAATHCHWPLQV